MQRVYKSEAFISYCDCIKTSGNTVLITGGATGIGFELASRFVKLGNKVIICGRRKDRLIEAERKLPGIHTISCDISKEADRVALAELIDRDFKELNVLVNNAGIQRKIDLKNGIGELLKNEDEIDINLKSQIYLAVRFIPNLAKQKEASIINVSSGLGFVPMAIFPIYSATKAAIHSFTMSLRYQIKDTTIKVFEVIPPTIYDTELKGKPIEKTDYSISASEMADAIISGFAQNQYEICAGATKKWLTESKAELDQDFRNINH